MPKTLAAKRAEAVQRAEARAARTDQQQIDLLKTRPGRSRKEMQILRSRRGQ